MEQALEQWVAGAPWWLLLAGVAVSFVLLGKGADWLVREAVALSLCWGVPKMIVGATVVSIGTTLPEAAVSVLAALRGQPGLALGNAVGSILCDTGLIIGLAAFAGPLPLPRATLLQHGRVQLGAGVLLVAATLPGMGWGTLLSEGGRLPRAAGFVFLALLAGYLFLSARWNTKRPLPQARTDSNNRGWVRILLRLAGGAGLVITGSRTAIVSATEVAVRLQVPEDVIAATLVALGTSLPELVTVFRAVRSGHGEIGLGNVIGADILNVLFVTGAAAAVTPGGLAVPPQFFRLFFPAMLLILVVFRYASLASGTVLKRRYALVLLAIYAFTVLMGYAQ